MSTRAVLDSRRAELADSLRIAVMKLSRLLRQHLLGGLTPQQRSVLATIGRNGTLSMSEIATYERVSRPGASGIVKRLEVQGLVSRSADPSDGRSTRVRLTESGQDELVAGRRESAVVLEERLAALSDEEMALLAKAVPLLARLVD